MGRITKFDPFKKRVAAQSSLPCNKSLIWWANIPIDGIFFPLVICDQSTSSIAQGGGGSFKNRKPIGEVGCCESGMAERSHRWSDRWLRVWVSHSLFLFPARLLPTVSICLSVHLSIYLSICHLLFCLSVHLSILFYLSIHLSIYLTICLSVCLSTYPAIYLSIYVAAYLSVYLSIYLSSIYLSVCLSIGRSIYQSIYHSVYLSI